jgi:serine O-acetyltransferase
MDRIKKRSPEFEILTKRQKKEIAKTVRKVKGAVSSVVDTVKTDVKATKERDPAARSTVEVLLLYPGVHAIAAHRLAHKLHTDGHTFSARAISQAARFATGIEIHPGATIGRGLMIDHGMGVVIGETAEIGDNCTIYQGVTLGGTGKDLGKRHPTLGNNVMVGAGAKVLGPMTIGDNSKVAANAVVLSEIPENSTAVGIPAKVVKREGVRVGDLDHIHIPDPVAQQIRRLEDKLSALEDELAAIKQEKISNIKTTE